MKVCTSFMLLLSSLLRKAKPRRGWARTIHNVVVKWIGKDAYSHAGNLAGLTNRGEKCSVKCGYAGMKGNSCSRGLHVRHNTANGKKEREHISRTVRVLDNIFFPHALFCMPTTKVSSICLKSKNLFLSGCWVLSRFHMAHIHLLLMCILYIKVKHRA